MSISFVLPLSTSQLLNTFTCDIPVITDAEKVNVIANNQWLSSQSVIAALHGGVNEESVSLDKFWYDCIYHYECLFEYIYICISINYRNHFLI
jgi:hypothetical protein